MRYIILFAITYFIIKSVRKFLSGIRFKNPESKNAVGQNGEPSKRIQVDESDIEDAEFKDVE